MRGNYGSYLLWIGIFVVFCGYVWWAKRYARNKAIETGKQAKLENLSNGISYLIYGVVCIAISIFNWQVIPSTVMGLAGIAFLLFGWRKIRQQR